VILKQAFESLARKTGLSSTSLDHQKEMKDAMVEALRELFRRTKLVGTKEDASFLTVDGVYEYYLDQRVLTPTGFFDITNKKELEIKTEEKFYRETPSPDYLDKGQPGSIIPKGKIRAKAQPTSDSVISVVSSSVDDNIVSLKYISIMGIVDGVQKTVQLQLNGTTPVVTSEIFSSIISVSKDITVGTVTVTSNSGLVEIEKIEPLDRENIRWRVHVLEKTPDSAYTIKYSYYRRPWDFNNLEDSIPIDEIWEDVFLTKATAIIYYEQGDSRAESWEIKSEFKIKAMQDIDIFAENMDMRFGFDGVSYENFK
jgi:hypothetical protein